MMGKDTRFLDWGKPMEEGEPQLRTLSNDMYRPILAKVEGSILCLSFTSAGQRRLRYNKGEARRIREEHLYAFRFQ